MPDDSSPARKAAVRGPSYRRGAKRPSTGSQELL
jgi:hypothetical protein